MVVASFLTKDLGIDWRWGEAYFAEHLNDFELSSNNGGWQWASSSGCDAQPYFRIFNPLLQSRKFDPHAAYIRTWVPELAGLPEDTIHAPWEKGLSIPGYPPRPLIEHTLVKERTLRAYHHSKSTPKP